ncbi:MAG: VOC family protein [Nannocystaceae bacterium]|nr:VOC family protein [Nannocystaceae bacterium]
MAHNYGSFVWFELVVPDIDKAIRFYPETFGFGTTEMDMGDFTYTMFTQGDKTVGGVVNPRGGPQPPHWTGYLAVADVDASLKTVKAKGGKVLAPAFDIPTVGRMAPIADPQGATLFLFKSEKPENRTDSMHWNELWAKDAGGVLDFYKALANAEVEEMKMPDDSTYYILKAEKERSTGGVMTSPDPRVPPMWLSYIAVDDVDGAVERASSNGGKTIKAPMDVENIGRFGIIADDQGAVVGVITPAN